VYEGFFIFRQFEKFPENRVKKTRLLSYYYPIIDRFFLQNPLEDKQMASLISQRGWYYSQFFNSHRKPKQARVPLKTKSKKVAQKLHRELEDQYALDKFDPWTGFQNHLQDQQITKDSSLRKVLDHYIEVKTREDWRTNTAKNTTYVLNAFARFAGEFNSIQIVTPRLINDFLNQSHLAYETKKSHRTKIKPFALWMKKNNLLSYDFSLVKIYNNDNEQEETISYLSDSEIETLKNGIKQKVSDDILKGYQKTDLNALWLLDFIDWQRYSGMRISETLSLTPASINTDTWQVTIGSDSFSTKSKRKQVLPIENVEVLKRIATKLIAECSHPHELLFKHKDRRRTSRTFKKYVRICLPQREDINIHSLRHTCCIELLRREVPIYTVQRWMRHSNIKTTLRYADLLATDISKAVGRAFST